MTSSCNASLLSYITKEKRLSRCVRCSSTSFPCVPSVSTIPMVTLSDCGMEICPANQTTKNMDANNSRLVPRFSLAFNCKKYQLKSADFPNPPTVRLPPFLCSSRSTFPKCPAAFAHNTLAAKSTANMRISCLVSCPLIPKNNNFR